MPRLVYRKGVDRYVSRQALTAFLSVPIFRLLHPMDKRFGGAFLGVIIYKAIAWSIAPAASEWSTEALEAVAIALFVTAVLELQDWWLSESDTTTDETKVSEAT